MTKRIVAKGARSGNEHAELPYNSCGHPHQAEAASRSKPAGVNISSTPGTSAEQDRVIPGGLPREIALLAGYIRCLFFEGRYQEAEARVRELRDILKLKFGPAHTYTLQSDEGLVNTYFGHGQWNEAEELCLQAMKMSQHVLGEEHLDTLISMGDLAVTCFKQGRLEEAEALELQVMKMLSSSTI